MAFQERGPNDRWMCRCGCGREIEKGRRRSWFSQECVDLYLIENDPAFARRKVYERDQGVCARCGTQCRHHEHGKSDLPRWEMDHRMPLSEGGSNTMDNLRTLCTDCHKGETKALAGRTAESRKQA